MLHDDEQQERDDGHEEIAGRAGEGDDDVVTGVALEVARGDGGGLGPAEEHAAVEETDERKEDGAAGIEMNERIEGDAAEHFGGGIAETPGGPGVSALVHAEGKDEDYSLKDYKDYGLVHGSSLSEW